MQGPMIEGSAQGMAREVQPIKERLLRRKQQLSTEMSKVDNLLTLLDENPSIEKFVDLMGGIQY